MSPRLGMNPELVRALSSAIDGQTELLDHAQESLAKAAAISQNPFNYMLNPGSLILAPASIGLILSANADLTYARASARELVQKLLTEAIAQEFASNASDASYILGTAWRTPDAKRVPDVSPWDFLGGIVTTGIDFLKDVHDLVQTVDAGLEVLRKWGTDTFKSISTWWDGLPSWAKGVKKFGRYLPWVGLGVTGVDLAVELGREDKNWWNITRYGVSAVLDIVSFIPPAAPFAAAAGLVWDIGWDTVERYYDAFTHTEELAYYYMEEPWMAAVHFIAPFTMDFWGPIAD